MLNLTIGDLLDGRSDGGSWSDGDLLDLTVGDLLHGRSDGGSNGGLLDLSIADLGGQGRGNKGESEDDFLDGRHCDEDGGYYYLGDL